MFYYEIWSKIVGRRYNLFTKFLNKMKKWDWSKYWRLTLKSKLKKRRSQLKNKIKLEKAGFEIEGKFEASKV